ncbi:hypothetical protein [Mycobacterium tuberculosis]
MDQWATGGSTDIDKLTFTCTPCSNKSSTRSTSPPKPSPGDR